MSGAATLPDRDFLFVQSTTELGGAERVLLNLFDASAELRRRSVIANLGFGEGALPTRLRALGAEVVDMPKARLRQPIHMARTIWALRALARSRSVKVIVGNGAHPQIIGGVSARLAGTRSAFLVNMIHAHPIWKNDLLDALALRVPCDLMLPNSEASRAPLLRLRPDVQAHLVYLGTPSISVDREAVEQARTSLGVGPGEVLVGVFGRLQRWKGQDVFVEAAAQVTRARGDVRFAVVGGSVFGLEREFARQLERRAAELGVSSRLTFTGFRDDVQVLLAACDIVCHTTRVPEPFGMVVIEAMAAGRPVIATLGGGPSEIIVPGESGRLIAPDRPDALAREIISLANDAPERARLGAAAAERARAQFSSERMARDLVRELEACAGSRSGERGEPASVVARPADN
jgi:glycosyltransferase involved in cell wall biosynthesis